MNENIHTGAHRHWAGRQWKELFWPQSCRLCPPIYLSGISSVSVFKCKLECSLIAGLPGLLYGVAMLYTELTHQPSGRELCLLQLQDQSISVCIPLSQACSADRYWDRWGSVGISPGLSSAMGQITALQCGPLIGVSRKDRLILSSRQSFSYNAMLQNDLVKMLLHPRLQNLSFGFQMRRFCL